MYNPAHADKKMDHAAYPKALKKMDHASLCFIIKDCRESIEANPGNANNGYYSDEILYAAAELKRRQK